MVSYIIKYNSIFAQQLVQANIEDEINAPHHCVWEVTDASPHSSEAEPTL